MGARRNPGSFALPVTSESAARRDFYRRGEGRGRCNEFLGIISRGAA